MASKMKLLPRIASAAFFLVNFQVVQALEQIFTPLSAEDNFSLNAFVRRLRDNGIENMEMVDIFYCGCVAILGMELLSFLVKSSGSIFKQIPVRGKHLDDLSMLDLTFVTLNKMAVIPFVYFVVRFAANEPNVVWSLDQVSSSNLLVPILPFFFIYDFFYTLLHWGLHIQAVYGYIHKHHHRQKAPSRANIDAVNVHPIEFFLGEYNHLFAVYIYTHLLQRQMHILSILSILIIVAVLAALNHTRFDSKITLFGNVTLYDSKWHDVHHRIPQSNYGQYSNFWDTVFGTFRKYDPNDRVNPNNQLDPRTGKSLGYGSKKSE